VDERRAITRRRGRHDGQLAAGRNHQSTGKLTHRNSFITDLPVERGNVAEMAACGGHAGKIENESFNTLKNQGYNLEPQLRARPAGISQPS